MPKIAISDAGLRSLEAPTKGQIDFWDSKFPSFGVRVSQGGSKTFVLKISNTRVSIGRYGIITLAEARTEAKRLLAEKTLGKVRPQSITFPEAFKVFIAEKTKSRRARTIKDYNRLINLHFPFKGQIGDIKHSDIERRLKRISAPSEYNHALQNAKTFFTWAHKRRYISDNPIIGFAMHNTQSRTRVLSDAELKKIWSACLDALDIDLSPSFAAIVQLLILTGQRKTEIASLRQSWLAGERVGQDDLWQINFPPEAVKNARPHTIPLGPEALQTLFPHIENGRDLIFPARGKDTPFNGWSKCKAALDKASGVTGWTLHDCRRTYRTIHAKIGTPPHIAERLVNHASARSKLEDIYDQYKYLPEMREAVDNYERFLLGLVR